MSGPLGTGSPLGGGGGGGGASSLATLYAAGNGAADSTFTLDSTRSGIIIDGSSLTTLSALVVKNGLAGGGVVAQVTSTKRTGFNLRDSGGTDRWTYGYCVSASDWITGTGAGDAVIGGPTGKFLHLGVLGGGAPSVSFDLANKRIGTGTAAAPSYALHVKGAGTTASRIEIENTLASSLAMQEMVSTSTSLILRAYGSTAAGTLFGLNVADSVFVQGDPVVAMAVGTSSNKPLAFAVNNLEAARVAVTTGNFLIGSTSDANNARLYAAKGSNTATSGTQRGIHTDATFAPTSGTGVFRGATVAYTINQTGGSSGNVTGLLVDATETAVGGTHLLLDLQKNTVSVFSVGPVQTKATNRICAAKGADVAIAGTITLGSDGNFFILTGNTSADFIATTSWTAGSVITLQFSGTPTLSHNTGSPPGGTAPMLLAGGVNYVGTANDTITFVYNGTAWCEIGRAVI